MVIIRRREIFSGKETTLKGNLKDPCRVWKLQAIYICHVAACSILIVWLPTNGKNILNFCTHKIIIISFAPYSLSIVKGHTLPPLSHSPNCSPPPPLPTLVTVQPSMAAAVSTIGAVNRAPVYSCFCLAYFIV